MVIKEITVWPGNGLECQTAKQAWLLASVHIYVQCNS